MIPHRSWPYHWTISSVLTFSLLFLIAWCASLTFVDAATNARHHGLSAITPSTTGLTISDPNVITHYVHTPNLCWPARDMYGTILTIDIGASYTTAAYTNKDGEFTLVMNEYGHTRTPTTIAFLPGDNDSNIYSTATNRPYKVLFGEAAELQRSSNPTNVIHDWQQWTFRSFNNTQGGNISVAPDFQDSGYMYKVVESPSFLPSVQKSGGGGGSWWWTDNEWVRDPVGQAVIQVSLRNEVAGVGTRRGGVIEKELYFRPEELTALLVHWIRDLAEAQIQKDGTGLNITHVVLAVPGELGFDQRQILKKTIQETESRDRIVAGLGVNVLRDMTRHHSTVLAYGLGNDVVYGSTGARGEEPRTAVVVDLEQEGAFEVRLIEIDEEMFETMGGVVVRKGLAGEEGVKQAVMNVFVDAFVRSEGEEIDNKEILQRREMMLSRDKVARRLGKEVFKATKLLRSASLLNTTIRLEMESFFDGRDLSVTLNLQQYLDTRLSTLQPIVDTVERLLKDSMQIENRDYVDHILVSGRSSRMPEVIQLLEQYFRGRLEVPQLIDPTLTSVHGAAQVARYFENRVECCLA